MVVYFNTIDVQLILTMKPVVQNEPHIKLFRPTYV